MKGKVLKNIYLITFLVITFSCASYNGNDRATGRYKASHNGESNIAPSPTKSDSTKSSDSEPINESSKEDDSESPAEPEPQGEPTPTEEPELQEEVNPSEENNQDQQQNLEQDPGQEEDLDCDRTRWTGGRGSCGYNDPNGSYIKYASYLKGSWEAEGQLVNFIIKDTLRLYYTASGVNQAFDIRSLSDNKFTALNEDTSELLYCIYNLAQDVYEKVYFRFMCERTTDINPVDLLKKTKYYQASGY